MSVVQNRKMSKKHGNNKEKEGTGIRDGGKINEVLKTGAYITKCERAIPE